MFDKISILGSTGSIGLQSLEVVEKLGIKVEALAVKSNIKMLQEQIEKYKPKVVAVFDEEKCLQLKQNVHNKNVEVLSGMDGLCTIASETESNMVLNAVVGMVGLKPTLEAVTHGKNIALANKETLVTGGALVMNEAERHNVKILPVDSEHSAVFQCLQGINRKEDLKRIILTASGGPFFGKSYDDLKKVTKAQTLKHPNWDMGAKITTDSATMMNKGLEISEASWLFGVSEKQIDVVIHRESIIHSMIEYVDNSVIAQLGIPDMRIPIQYAITYPERFESPVKGLSLTDIGKLTFFEPDYDTFLCLKACKFAIEKGGLAMTVANAANEQAVELFLNDKITFVDIGEIVWKAVNEISPSRAVSLDSIIKTDKHVRNFVREYFDI